MNVPVVLSAPGSEASLMGGGLDAWPACGELRYRPVQPGRRVRQVGRVTHRISRPPQR